VANGLAFFLTDFRYGSQAEKQVTSMRKIVVPDLFGKISDLLAQKKAGQIAFEDRHLTVADFKKLKKGVKAVWKPRHIAEELRLIKDDEEMKIIERNFRILARVFREIPEIIKPGVREKDVAAELEYRLRKAGADGKAFDYIVASGKRSALPHGVATNKKIGRNDFVTLDWGCTLDGYHSDNTRNFALGRPTGKMREIFDIVLEANRRAIDAVKPGALLKDIDRAARDYIKERGYEKFFGHGTGHGLGLDIHENPAVNPASNAEAQEGMVFTIEPGIYIPGLGGVRIEDVLLVTKNGCRLLSRNLPRELWIL